MTRREYGIPSYDELEHHGIIGQKWGIRRYQNYDGSYTKAGMKRYNKSLEEYNRQNERYKELKKSGAEKDQIANAKIAKKSAMRKLDKDYKHLKQDKLGDQGKKLYADGKTITGNANTLSAMGTIASLSIAGAKYFYEQGNAPASNALAAIGGLTIAAATAKTAANVYQDRRLRAYYGHTSNY